MLPFTIQCVSILLVGFSTCFSLYLLVSYEHLRAQNVFSYDFSAPVARKSTTFLP